MVVLATVIEIGVAAIDRTSTGSLSNTCVNKGGPATDTGTITSIEIWANGDLTNVEVATFISVEVYVLSTRDTVTIGSVTGGSKQTFTEDSGGSPISLEVHEGDLIGIYAGSGTIERSESGGLNVLIASGDHIPCTEQSFSFWSGDIISLYATGTTEEEEVNATFFGTNF